MPLTPSVSAAIPSPFGHPAHQRFGLMDIQVIQDHVPLRRLGIAGNQALEMRQRILLSACGSPGGFNDVPGDDIKIDEPGQRAMPDILEFASQHMPGCMGRSGCLRSKACTPVSSSMLMVRSPCLARCGAWAYTSHPWTIFSSRRASGTSVNQ